MRQDGWVLEYAQEIAPGTRAWCRSSLTASIGGLAYDRLMAAWRLARQGKTNFNLDATATYRAMNLHTHQTIVLGKPHVG